MRESIEHQLKRIALGAEPLQSMSFLEAYSRIEALTESDSKKVYDLAISKWKETPTLEPEECVRQARTEYREK